MTPTYCLSGHLDSTSAPDLASDLLERRGGPVCVDASEVTFAGTLALQILVSAQKQWSEDGHDFAVKPLSEGLSQAATGLGVKLSDIGADEADVLAAEENL